MWGTFWLNIDEARRGIAAGTIKAETQMVPVIKLKAFLGLEDSDFGSNDFNDPSGFDLMSAVQTRKHMKGMPDDKYNEPAMIVLWKNSDAMVRAGMKKINEHPDERAAPWIVDGNHRLARMFLEGREEPVPIYIVPYQEALKFAFDSTHRKLNAD